MNRRFLFTQTHNTWMQHNLTRTHLPVWTIITLKLSEICNIVKFKWLKYLRAFNLWYRSRIVFIQHCKTLNTHGWNECFKEVFLKGQLMNFVRSSNIQLLAFISRSELAQKTFFTAAILAWNREHMFPSNLAQVLTYPGWIETGNRQENYYTCVIIDHKTMYIVGYSREASSNNYIINEYM